jgi:hypothetical protein
VHVQIFIKNGRPSLRINRHSPGPIRLRLISHPLFIRKAGDERLPVRMPRLQLHPYFRIRCRD